MSMPQVHVIGHSMGGMILTRALTLHDSTSDLIRSAVLLGSSCFLEASWWRVFERVIFLVSIVPGLLPSANIIKAYAPMALARWSHRWMVRSPLTCLEHSLHCVPVSRWRDPAADTPPGCHPPRRILLSLRLTIFSWPLTLTLIAGPALLPPAKCRPQGGKGAAGPDLPQHSTFHRAPGGVDGRKHWGQTTSTLVQGPT